MQSHQGRDAPPQPRALHLDQRHDPASWANIDAIEDVIGLNILCWNTSFFIKEARDPGFVSWHQDATYCGLSSS